MGYYVPVGDNAVFGVPDVHWREDPDDVLWAYLTQGRADTRAFILVDVPGFYRDPKKDHWGRLAIDATKPFDRQGGFERKRIAGADSLNLADYIDPDQME